MAEHAKVIQPVSSDLRPADAASVVASAPNTPAIPSPSAGTPTHKPDPSSIYPEVTHGIAPPQDDSAAQDTVSGNLASQPEKTKIIVVCIWLLGALIAVPTILSVARIGFFAGFGLGYGVLGMAQAIIYVLIGIGLIVRKEMARVACIVVVLFFSVLNVFGVAVVLKGLHDSNSAQTQTESGSVLNDGTYKYNREIQPGQPSPKNPAQEKESRQMVRGLAVYLVYSLGVAAVVVVFLTRPSVKRLFS